ncbi:hypothetical protein MN608_08725 [Microdochium nivale]|nr:hypothetical protein MN608_08725 [Microdochium nivale]
MSLADDAKLGLTDVALSVELPVEAVGKFDDKVLDTYETPDDEVGKTCVKVESPPGAGTPESQRVLVKFPGPEEIIMGVPGREASDVGTVAGSEISVTTVTVHVDPTPVPKMVLVVLLLGKGKGGELVTGGRDSGRVLCATVRLVTAVDVHEPPAPVPIRVPVVF